MLVGGRVRMSDIAGTNFTVVSYGDETAIILFGTLFRAAKGTLVFADTEGARHLVEAARVIPVVNRAIAEDVDAGKDARIAGIELDSISAAAFFHKGGIIAEHFERAIEDTDLRGPYIDLPGVNVKGRALTVRIRQATPGQNSWINTIDSAGVVI
jgi:membrane-associated protease RseP (regulator of RpoE activity)